MKKTFSAVCLALSLVSGHALAQSDYPNRPIKAVVPFAAG